MTSIWPLRLRPLLTLIFLTGLVRPPLTDATVDCRTGRFKQGEIITTSSESSQKLYCGARVGQFLAVKENVLFHLDCPKGSPPGKATAVIINMTEPRIVMRYFDDQQGCDVKAPQGMTTGANAYAVADVFKGGRVPYHGSCNAQHYFDYLLYGRVNNQYSLHASCPVYGEFNARSSINKSSFRLKGKVTEYTWSNSRAKELVVVNKMAIVGGRGGGGGRGSSGSRGTRSGGGTDGSGSGAAGKLPYVAGGGAARRSASSASRPTPWPFGDWRAWSRNYRKLRSRRS